MGILYLTQRILMAHLEKENAKFDEIIESLIAENSGKFALIHGENVDVYETFDDAVQTGYEKYGLEPFLVKRITNSPSVHFITRLTQPVHADL